MTSIGSYQPLTILDRQYLIDMNDLHRRRRCHIASETTKVVKPPQFTYVRRSLQPLKPQGMNVKMQNNTDRNINIVIIRIVFFIVSDTREMPVYAIFSKIMLAI